jgi:hypothetical protein
VPTRGKLYHYLPAERPPGSIVKPGNFGRLIRNRHTSVALNGRVFVLGLLCRETLWELIRVDKYSHLPSRLDCVFVLPTWTDVKAYGRNNNPDGRQVLHEVILENPGVKFHVGWISHCTMQSGGSFLDQMEPKAHAYWSGKTGDPSQGKELLVAGPVRIVRRVRSAPRIHQ